VKGAGGTWCPPGQRPAMAGGQPGPGRARLGSRPGPVVPASAVVGRRRRASEQACCVPSGCVRHYAGDTIDPEDPGDAVKVVCSNPSCVVGSWMHADCYEEWQQRVLFYIRYALLDLTELKPLSRWTAFHYFQPFIFGFIYKLIYQAS